MKINPKTGELFADDGRFLKLLYCPEAKDWMDLKPQEIGSRTCDTCSRTVHDTSLLTDDEVVSLLDGEPGTCLAVSPTQENCTVLPVAMTRGNATQKLP